MRNVARKSCRENQNTHFTFRNFFFENSAVSAIMWKNTVEPERPQMTIRSIRISRWVPKVTHTLGICNINCFSATIMVARKRLYVTLYVHCLSCYFFPFSPFFFCFFVTIRSPSCLSVFPLSQYCVAVLFTLCGTKIFGPLLQHFQQECFYPDSRKGTPEGICMNR